MRLVHDSAVAFSGRVELCIDGEYATVCGDGWDTKDATVACRMLGFETDSAIATKGYASMHGECLMIIAFARFLHTLFFHACDRC